MKTRSIYASFLVFFALIGCKGNIDCPSFEDSSVKFDTTISNNSKGNTSDADSLFIQTCDNAATQTNSKEDGVSTSPMVITADNVLLLIDSNAMSHDVRISIETTTEELTGPMPDYLTNLTAGGAVYRMLPDGLKFNQDITIAMRYDSTALPYGYTADDIYTFFYNEQTHIWQRIERDSVDIQNQIVYSHTNHFTDYINGVLTVPESSDAMAYTPTSIKDLKAADPMEGITLIAPPEANNMGTANLTYPLAIPAGRHGMQPQLAVTYNSSGGSGILGLGWSLPISEICVDTRRGVPLFSDTLETETYALDGEILVNAHVEDGLFRLNSPTYATPWKSRLLGMDSIRFYPRVEGSFRRIVRYGTGPTNYHWVVTDKNGTKYYYGGEDSTCLKDSLGNIARWCLQRVEDTYGNEIRYNYITKSYTAPSGNVAKQILLQNINYTAHKPTDESGKYDIRFNYSSTIKIDAVTSARLGFLEADAYLLDHIDVLYDSSPIKSFYLGYKQGAFGRTLLCNIIEADLVAQQYGCSDCGDSISAGESWYESCYIPLKKQYDSLANDLLQWCNAGADTLKGLWEDFLTQLLNCLYGDSLSIYGSGYFDNRVYGSITKKSVFERGVYNRCDALEKSCKRMGVSEHKFTYAEVPNNIFSSVGIIKNSDSEPDNIEGPLFLVKGTPGPIEGTGTRTWNLGGALDVGYDNIPFLKSVSAGGGYTYSQSETDGLVTLIDLNGDGLLDKVYKRDSSVYYRFRDPGNISFFLEEVNLPDIKDFLFSSSTSKTWGVEGCLGSVASASFGINWTESNSTVTTYFCDMDGDGLPDLVKDGKVLYNRILDAASGTFEAVDDTAQYRVIGSCGRNDTIYIGQPVDTTLFSNSQDTSRLMWACWTDTVDAEYGITRDTCGWVPYSYSYPKPYQPNLENVRFWEAPYSGRIRLRDTVYMPLATFGDGVRLIVQFNEDSLFLKDTIALPGTDTSFMDTIINVIAGNKIYYRLLSRDDRIADRIYWNPTISYVDTNNVELSNNGPDGLDSFQFSYEEDFLLSGIQKIIMPFDARLRIDNVAFYAPSSGLFSSAQLNVLINGHEVDSMTFDISDDSSHHIYYKELQKDSSVQFRIVASGPLEWSNIKAKCRITLVENLSTDTDDTVYTCIDTLSIPDDTIYFFDYYPQIQKLVYKDDNGNITSGMYADYSDSIYSYFGTMYRNWGQFAYKSKNINSVIHFSELHPSGIEAVPDSASFCSIPSNAQLSLSQGNSAESEVTIDGMSAYNPLAEVFFPMQPDFRKECWSAYSDYAYIEQYRLSNTPHPADGITESHADSIEYMCTMPVANSNAKVVNKNSTNSSFGLSCSANLSISGFSLGGSTSRTTSESRQLTDMMDLNGDRFPDVLTEKGVQYTSSFGGLSTLTKMWDDDYQRFESSLDTTTGGSFSGSAIVMRWQLNRSVRHAAKEISAKVGADISTTEGNSTADATWLDINGDGLPDRIFQKDDSLFYSQNIGHKFLHEGLYDNIIVRHSKSTGESGGASLSAAFEDSWWNAAGTALNILDTIHNMAVDTNFINVIKDQLRKLAYTTTLNVSITAGLATSVSKNSNDMVSIDINGDGLPDHIKKDSNYYEVRFNTGNSFDGGQAILLLGGNHDNYSYSTDLTGALTAGVTLGVIPLKIVANAKGGLSRSLSNSTAQWMDMNADGIPDYVWKTGDNNIGVEYTNLGVVNKLVGVELPSGGSYEVAYALNDDGPKSNMRHYVMSSLTVKDNRMQAPDLHRSFQYTNRYYDRIEREDYGYAKVVTVEHNTNHSVYRYNVQQFHNQDYLFHGLCYSNAVVGSINGDTLSAQRREYRLFDIITGDLNSNSRPGCYGDGFPSILSDSTIYYDNGQRKIVSRYRFGYTRFGNIDTVYDDGALNDPNDDYMAVSVYDSIGDYIVAAVLEERITGGNTLYRHRSALRNAITGDIRRLIFHNNTGGNSVYDFHYDCYGNMDTIIYPENHVGQRYYIAYKYDNMIHMLPTETTNAYNLTSTADYSFEWQKPKKTISVNGAQSEYLLDGHGRISALYAPFEFGTDRPTIRYEYYDRYPHTDAYWDTCMFWARTLNHNVDSDYISTITISDGLGRPRVVKKEADVDGLTMRIVGGWIELDAFGRKVREYYPDTEALSTPDSTFNSPLSTFHSQLFYDRLDRVVKTSYPDGTFSKSDYTIDNDADGILRLEVETTDQNGHTSYVFSNVREQNTTTIDPLDATTVFHYDHIGQLQESIDPEGHSTYHTYDMLGRRTDRVHPSAGHTQWDYDAAGNMLRQTQNDDQWIEYKYEYNRPVHIMYSDRPWNNVWYKYGNSGTEAGRIVYQQDATGVQQFHYDFMGNVDTNWHTYVQPHSSSTLSLKTAWRYDSWGRVLNITYPDREKVDYKYDLGGMLYSVEGYKSGNVGSTSYIHKILYDHFGQRTQVIDGDSVKTTYDYDPATRRLAHLENSSTLTGETLQDNRYYYDAVGNIDSIRDNGRNHRVQTYKYDDANRLIGSDGSIMQEHSTAQPYGYEANYTYSPAGRFLNKYVDSKRLSTAMGQHQVLYDNEYSYTHPDNPYAITHIQDAYGAHYDFGWDAKGNLNKSYAYATHTSRRLCWTEDNRLQAFMERGDEGGIAAYYNYSADGERNIKLTSPRLNIQQNATLFNNPPLVYPTLYASSLVTLTKQGYTKHYFEEGRRICSKIGGGMRGNVTVEEIDSRVGELASSYEEQYHSQNDGIRQTFHDCIGADPQIIDDVNFHSMLIDRELRRDVEEPTYFYHSDHLGSAAYLTYQGSVIQTLNYLPYGEDWVEYNFFHPNDTTRLGIYRFNGKEKDHESGFHYYGARYYWSEVLTGWLSVDPMADSLPSISSYDYCLNNPIVMVDIDGNIPIIPIIWTIYEIGSSIYDAYETANTITNPNATTAEKISASTGFFIGLFVTGGGYSKVLKEGTKLSENTIKTFTLNSGRITSKLADSKPMQNLANKLLKYSKDGNLPTPKNNPEQFIRIKGSKNWKHKETGAIYSESPSSHKGKEKGEYKIFPAGTKESEFGTAKESGKRITINKDGEILGT